MMKPSEILSEARNLLSDPDRWTQWYYARDEKGNHRQAQSKDAVCFCSIGAIMKASGRETSIHQKHTGQDLEYLAQAMRPDRQGMSVGQAITRFNDASDRSHKEVLAAFDKAIVIAQTEGN